MAWSLKGTIKGPVGSTGPTGANGAQGPPGPNAVSANPGNVAGLGTDSLILVPGPVSGDASPAQVVKGNDSRLNNARTPTVHAPSHAHGGSDPVTVTYSDLAGIPASFNPSLHAATHKSGGSDALGLDTLGATTDVTNLNVSTSAHGLCPKAPADATKVLRGDGLFGALAYSSLSGIPSTFAPSAHAASHAHGGSDPVTVTYSDLAGIPASFNPSVHGATHKSGGADVIALDSLGPTTDITTLNASTTAHGLLPKLNNVATNYLTGTGVWAAVAYASLTGIPATFSPSAHASTHNIGGSDVLASATATVAGLVPTPPNSTAHYFRGDASFQLISSLSIAYGQLTGVPASFAPSAHAATHKSGGADLIALDTLGATTDITALNVSATAHGLCPKAPNLASQVLLGTGVFGVLAYSSLSGIPTTFAPSAHAASHISTGADALALVSSTASGLVPTAPNDATKALLGTGAFGTLAYSALGSIPTSFSPSAHAVTHKSGGTDAIALDTLGATTDVTTLNSSTTAHGLLPKLAGGTTAFFRADGSWAAVTYASLSGIPASFAPSAHAATHNLGGSDALAPDWTQIANKPASFAPSAHAFSHVTGGADLIPAPTTLASGLVPPIPNDTSKFLRGDGIFAVGPGGPAGAPGANGQPAYTLSTAGFTVPAVGLTVTVSVSDTSWVALQEILWIADAGGPGVAGAMQVTAKTANSLTLLNI